MKRFTMIVTMDENGSLYINTKNEGFSACEILGSLECKKDDIIHQMKCNTDFKRILVDDGKEFNITEEESECI